MSLDEFSEDELLERVYRRARVIRWRRRSAAAAPLLVVAVIAGLLAAGLAGPDTEGGVRVTDRPGTSEDAHAQTDDDSAVEDNPLRRRENDDSTVLDNSGDSDGPPPEGGGVSAPKPRTVRRLARSGLRWSNRRARLCPRGVWAGSLRNPTAEPPTC